MFSRKFYSLVCLIIALSLTLHACSTFRNRTAYDPPVWAPDSQQIAFAAKKDENWDIYKVNIDGTGLTQLTTHPELDRYPAWSPNGKNIVFSSHRDRSYDKGQTPGECCGDVYSMDVSSLEITRLTEDGYFPRSPEWSPDGQHIAFVSDDEIYVMDVDGANRTKLVSNQDEGSRRVINGSLRWSPDGSKIVFTSSSIWCVDVNNGRLTQLSNTFDSNTHSPSWSFDGEKLVYSQATMTGFPKNIEFVDQGVWIVDTQNPRLPEKLADGTGAVWSPNSLKIAFSCPTEEDESDHTESSICLIDADGSNLIKLNHSGSFLRWSPDGTKIAFISKIQKRQNNVFVINTDGSGLVQLTGKSK